MRYLMAIGGCVFVVGIHPFPALLCDQAHPDPNKMVVNPLALLRYAPPRHRPELCRRPGFLPLSEPAPYLSAGLD